MYRYVQAFPVLPGKSDDDAKAVSAYFNAHPDEYWESRRSLGMRLERAYLQKTPMGSFVVAYWEGDHELGEMLGRMAKISNPADRRFADLAKEIHGVDLTKPMPGPLPETIGDWRDETVTEFGKGMAFMFPVLTGKAEAGKTFAREAYSTRRPEFAVSRRGWGETAEVVTLLQTPMGDAMAAYLEGQDPREANRRFAASQAPFDRWFKDELGKLVPPQIDFNQPLDGTEEIFDSQKVRVKAGVS
jgi:hypothetical protein